MFVSQAWSLYRHETYATCEIIGVRNCELRVVQSSLIGAMLSNLLLILGICLFSGGMQYLEQGFDISMFQMYSVILQITVIAALIPAAFNYLAGPRFPNVIIQAELLQISHIVAVILLFLYFTFVFFQLHSHAQMYCEVERKGKRFTTKNNPTGIIVDEQEEILPMLSVRVALLFLVLIIALTVVTLEFLVISIGDLTARVDINKQWIGLILLPLLSGNTMGEIPTAYKKNEDTNDLAERFKSVTVSMKNKVDLCMEQALGSSIQIAILVIPLVTVIAWMMEKPLMLSSDPFESIVLFFSASALSRILAHGKTNWLTGALLIKLYLLIAIVYWFHPGVDTAELSFECTVVHAFGKVEK
ncbi:hypothetical protein QCA50_011697 [Cerrena zonata]|uniref:Sodium/calcium exchanger membrane region domain-containing protein n=1 Tax=Cerrena zonata TaxID=2478898 RepID=A0AAW0FW89_9APHY